MEPAQVEVFEDKRIDEYNKKVIEFQENEYDGEFHSRFKIPHGQGEMIFPNGNKYKGNFKFGQPFGFGEMFMSNNEKFVGNFKNGKFSGFGKYSYADGSYYEGLFQNGFKNGEGKNYDRNGDHINQKWMHGNLVP